MSTEERGDSKIDLWKTIERGNIMAVSEKVIETLKAAGKPMKGGEIAEAAGIDKKEVDKAIKDLKKLGLIESPKNCYYAVKSEE